MDLRWTTFADIALYIQTMVGSFRNIKTLVISSKYKKGGKTVVRLLQMEIHLRVMPQPPPIKQFLYYRSNTYGVAK